MAKNKVLFLVNRDSFPVKCPELDDFLTLVISKENEVENYYEESPTLFFKTALSRTEDYELVVPVTRNMYVRDRLRLEGVNLVVCL